MNGRFPRWLRGCRLYVVVVQTLRLKSKRLRYEPFRVLAACASVAIFASIAQSAQPRERFLRDLPAGLFVSDSYRASPDETRIIGQKLGGKIERLTNSTLQVHGIPIQVNAITAVDEPNAEAIHQAISQFKAYPFVMRQGRVVIEYTGDHVDEPLATKTSYELGLVKKPDRVRYRVIAEMATVENADYMACNPLFNQFIALDDGSSEDAIRQIEELSKQFQWGRALSLRNSTLENSAATYRFQPRPTDSEDGEATTVYSFGQLPNRQGVPYVTTTIEITVDDTGFQKSDELPKDLTAATPFWPADDPRVITLAKQITRGKDTNDSKVSALLNWLAPGKHLKFSGQTGSRWGTIKAFEQKFGQCWDFSDCFVTLARAAGVPSRQVAGWLYGSSGHVWAEYYSEKGGWQQVDPTGGGALKCGIYHIPYLATNDGGMPLLYVSMPTIEAMQP